MRGWRVMRSGTKAMGNVRLATALYLLAAPIASSTSKNSPEIPTARQPVTVAQLTDTVDKAKTLSDEDASKAIEHLELTERLSTPERSRLTSELSGAHSRAALMAVGDASVFLDPPSSEILDKPAPDTSEQRQIISRADKYLDTVIPRLPDFYATRITNLFKVAWTAKDKQGTHEPTPLNLVGRFRARVLYRNGKEIVQAEGAEQRGLITLGTFGPLLAIVMKDNLQQLMQWHGWLKSPNGAIAVFQFQVSQKDSHYSVSLPEAGLPFASRVGYKGEIGIDPDTGTILRLVLQSDPGLAPHALEHADIMLEYGPVAIGGKTYICPVRGVSMSRAKYQEMGIIRRDRAFILLSDVAFTNYHVFRSEMRIVPE